MKLAWRTKNVGWSGVTVLDLDNIPPMLPKDAPMLVVSRLFGRPNNNPDAALVTQVVISYSDGTMTEVWEA